MYFEKYQLNGRRRAQVIVADYSDDNLAEAKSRLGKAAATFEKVDISQFVIAGNTLSEPKLVPTASSYHTELQCPLVQELPPNECWQMTKIGPRADRQP
ncbi:hypothetical protein ACFX5Q_14795 [Mesorhizobium sp. IMUNJ 23033]|uniref:hypothetical protein n=1 Tax=Mesorhizobium sp. IMUNJ 23033 TaxID=3378039 RepID=UPI00384E9491